MITDCTQIWILFSYQLIKNNVIRVLDDSFTSGNLHTEKDNGNNSNESMTFPKFEHTSQNILDFTSFILKIDPPLSFQDLPCLDVWMKGMLVKCKSKYEYLHMRIL